MNRDPRLAFECGDTADVQKTLSVTLCLAPFDRILPVAAGLFRARYGLTALTERVWRSPETLLNEEREAAERARRNHGAWVLPHAPLVLSEPVDAGGATLIEDAGNPWIAAAIARFRPGVAVLSLRAGLIAHADEVWRFTLRRGSRMLRRVEAERDEMGQWQVRSAGKPQAIEKELGGDASCAAPDLEALHALARAAGVDLRACIEERRAFRSCALTALDDRDPHEMRVPTRIGQPVLDAALREGFGAGEDVAPAHPSGFADAADAAASEAETQRAIARAKSIEDIRKALAAAAPLAAEGPMGRHRLGSLYSLAVARAQRIDLDCLLTRRLERDWHDVMADTDYAVSRAAIEADREKAQRNQVLRPLARRHEAICRAAKSPADLLPVLCDLTDGSNPAIDERFREMALQVACKRARELDADDPVTARLMETLLDWQSSAKRAARAAARRENAPARPARRSKYQAAQALR